MITKQELLTFVQEIPDDQFSAEQEAHYKPLVAEMLYTFCCDGVVLAALSYEGIESCGYDARGIDRQTLWAIADLIRDDLDLEELVVSALEEMEIPKEADEEDSV